MSQGSNYLPTTGVFSGLTAANDLNAALDALLTGNSGSSAPTNALGGVPKLGQVWIDTTNASFPVLKQYTGAAWVVQAVLDVANGLWLPVKGGGIGTIASATTCDIGSQPQSCLTVTGTTTITGLGTSAAKGQEKLLVFGGILTLTYNATSLIIPGGLNKVTAAGDVAEAVYLGSGNWRLKNYVPLVGTNVTSIAGNTGDFTLNEGLTHSTNKILVDPAYLQGNLSGLTLQSGGGLSVFNVQAGFATDTAQGGLMLLPSVLQKSTSAWAVGGGGNGALDTGTIANNTWYHVHLIKRPDTGVVDALVSLDVNLPAMPTNYTLHRRIGSMKTDGSAHWIAFTQTGDTFIWATTVADVNNGAVISSSRAGTALTVPLSIVVTALFRATLGIAHDTTALLFTSLQETDQAPVGGALGDLQSGAAFPYSSGSFARVTNTASQIGVRSSFANATGLYINTYGWIDTRGK